MVRNVQLDQYNFILVVGEKERVTNNVNVCTRDNKIYSDKPVAEVMTRLSLLKQSRCCHAELLHSEEEWQDYFPLGYPPQCFCCPGKVGRSGKLRNFLAERSRTQEVYFIGSWSGSRIKIKGNKL
ncbi:threonine-tRNA ligase, cytoplasmic-like [Arapaima gigas]